LYDSKINTNSPVPFVKTSEKIDVVFPAVHGTFGEDGTIQGLLEMSGIPYVGAGVTGSAVGMDKVLQKDILRQNGIPVPDYQLLLREDWEKTRKIKVKFPAVVKPANLGSSVAVTKVRNQKELEMAIDLAAQFDRRIIIEECLENVIEINCSVLGYKTLEASVCEQPVKSTDLLSYEDKYLKGSKTKGMASLSRLIPAPIPTALTKKIQETAKKVFRILDASGVARIDFFVDVKKNKIWVCEINTLPGSISFYLWEKSGYPFPKLVDKLVELAYERFNDRKKTQYSFSSNLLQTLGKGAKGTKN
jgi:D-alanine-D-alanine ligase